MLTCRRFGLSRTVAVRAAEAGGREGRAGRRRAPPGRLFNTLSSQSARGNVAVRGDLECRGAGHRRGSRPRCLGPRA